MPGDGAAYCPECGAPVTPDDTFCGSCGTSLAEEAPAAEQPPSGEAADGAARGPSRRTLVLFAIGIALALIGGGLVIVLTGEEAEASEVLLQPVNATAPDLNGDGTTDPFTEPLGEEERERGNITAVPDLTVNVGGRSTELYGGTGDIYRCSKSQLIAFLEQNPAKARAWARVQGITAREIPVFVNSLIPVVTAVDIRVTNHGFVNGVATPIHSVLQAGTALLVDEYGQPRVRCKCGNPLLPPRRVTSPTYTGKRWQGFNPGVTAAAPRAPASQFGVWTLRLRTGEYILVGERFELGSRFSCEEFPELGQDCNVTGRQSLGPYSLQLLLGPFGSTEEATSAFCGNIVPDTVRYLGGGVVATLDANGKEYDIGHAPACPNVPTQEPPEADLTTSASATASTEFSAEFPAELGIDGDTSTSWFSAGPGPDGTSTFTIALAEPSTITRMTFEGNQNHADPNVRFGFGFGDWTIEMVDASGEVVASVNSDPGGGDQGHDISVPEEGGEWGVVEIRFIGRGHQDPTCGGFSELQVFGYPTPP